jgi:hypothetical protein
MKNWPSAEFTACVSRLAALRGLPGCSAQDAAETGMPACIVRWLVL